MLLCAHCWSGPPAKGFLKTFKPYSTFWTRSYFQRAFASLPYNGTLQAQQAAQNASASASNTSRPKEKLQLLDARAVSLDHPTYMVWGANTDVGKTIISAGLALAACQRRDPLSFLYVKPVQTGFPKDCDARFVRQTACEALKVASIFDEWTHGKPLPKLLTVSLFQWEPPVSPHVAAKDTPVSDEALRKALRTALRECRMMGPASVSPQVFSVDKPGQQPATTFQVADSENSTTMQSRNAREALEQINERLRVEAERKWVTIVETAGGVASPGPSGQLQCDIYRPLRLPGVLVGDGRLGGISATIAALETLLLRGYDTAAVVLMDHGLGNGAAIEQYLQSRVPVVVLPKLPPAEEEAAGGTSISNWLFENRRSFDDLLGVLEKRHVARLQRLRTMAGKAGEVLWWPFTQHALVAEPDVTVIDSRSGDEFAVYSGKQQVQELVEQPASSRGKSSLESSTGGEAMTSISQTSEHNKDGSGSPPETLNPSFDACASWWTQGLSLEGQLELTRAAAYAAARYGHVMFPENVHEPALALAEKLLQGPGKGWASRVFYSDNGSTAIEVAIKMAFRKFSTDRGLINSEPPADLYVLALNGSYHGDTLGAMEAQASTPYTGPLQQPWYRGRGCFLDPPKAFYWRGTWHVRWEVDSEQVVGQYSTKEELFSESRSHSEHQKGVYEAYIEDQIKQFEKSNGGPRVGGLILEPVVHGAGGMELIDPLFQATLIDCCKERGIPVILDEVFAGIWRLGRETAVELLHRTPDVACYAKLLTGGVVPLAVTLATQDVFNSFLGDSKLEALLHGHSYTAHAIGCAAAVASLDIYTSSSKNPNYDQGAHRLKEMWDSALVKDLSFSPRVTRVVAIGTILAVELQSQTVGYGSLASREIVRRLRGRGVYCRSLGNVMYLMCTPMTKVERCTQLLTILKEEIERT